MRSVRVGLAPGAPGATGSDPHGYDVHIGAGLGQRAGELVKACVTGAKIAGVIVDPNVPKIHVDSLAASLHASGLHVHLIAPDGDRSGSVAQRWEPGERVKTLSSLEGLCAKIAQAGLSRSDVVITLGGGIVGDVGGFAAASYRRGVAWVNMPTTLLAMVDAGLGGKTGVNLVLAGGLLKNMVGTLWQPSLVLMDPLWLVSLPARQLACGLAECVKHAMIARSVRAMIAPLDPRRDLIAAACTWEACCDVASMLRAVQTQAVSGRADGASLARVEAFLAGQAALKASVVEHDPRETASDAIGGRALLNLGHTFGHAIESLGEVVDTPEHPAHAPLHGEAVGLGLIAAAAAGEAMKQAPAGLTQRVGEVLTSIGLPTLCRGLPSNDDMIERMQHDKKALGGVLRIIVPTGDGEAMVVASPPRDALCAGWNTIRA